MREKAYKHFFINYCITYIQNKQVGFTVTENVLCEYENKD